MKIKVYFIILSFISLTAYSQDNSDTTSDEDNTVFAVVDQMPEFPGGTSGLYDFLARNLRYPDVAAKKGIEGKVFVAFIVDKNGAIKDVTVLRGVDPELDNEAVRIVKSMPPWKPGRQSDKNVNVRFSLPLTFKLNAPPPKEVMPGYPGGPAQLMKFIKENLKQPKGNNQEGLVVVNFVIDSTGVPEDFKIEKSLSVAHDEEALRVLKLIDKWTPGTQGGKPVRVRFSVPVRFSGN